MQEALIRCFTERMQGRADLEPAFDNQIHDDAQDYTLVMTDGVFEKDLTFLETGETVAFPQFAHGELLTEIEQIRAICRKMGTDCMVIDLTHPVLNFPVVRVIMPGVSDTLVFGSQLPRERDILTGFVAGERNAVASFFARG